MEKAGPLCDDGEGKDDNYFGEQGRNMFYQRAHWLQQQGEIVSAQSRDSVSNAYFDRDKDAIVFSRKGWNGRKRLNRIGHDDFDDSSTIGSYGSMGTAGAFSGNSSLSGSIRNTTAGGSGGTASRCSGSRANGTSSSSRGSSSSSRWGTNSLLSATPNKYVDNLKLLSPRTRFISSCMKEGNRYCNY